MWSFKKSTNPSPKEKKAIFITLLFALLVALGITSIGFIDNNLRLESDYLTITGPYGTTLPISEIDSIYLTIRRPQAIRISGYQMGYRKKGRFKSKNGEEFLMLVNSRAMPWIVIQRIDGYKIYFSHSRRSNEEICSDILETLPNKDYSPSPASDR
jgi:hypothetical protein